MSAAGTTIKRKTKRVVIVVDPQIHEILHQRAYHERRSIQGLVHSLLCRALKRRDLLVRTTPPSDVAAE